MKDVTGESNKSGLWKIRGFSRKITDNAQRTNALDNFRQNSITKDYLSIKNVHQPFQLTMSFEIEIKVSGNCLQICQGTISKKCVGKCRVGELSCSQYKFINCYLFLRDLLAMILFDPFL